MTIKICSIQGCRGRTDGNMNIIMFRFPVHDAEMRKEWCDITGIPEENLKSSSRICSRHFEPENIIVELKRLKPGTKPTLNLEPGEPLIRRKKGKAKNRCRVPFCYGEPPLRLFTVPTDPERRKIWLSACGLKEKFLKLKVCELHFPPEVLETPLPPHIYPTRNLPPNYHKPTSEDALETSNTGTISSQAEVRNFQSVSQIDVPSLNNQYASKIDSTASESMEEEMLDDENYASSENMESSFIDQRESDKTETDTLLIERLSPSTQGIKTSNKTSTDSRWYENLLIAKLESVIAAQNKEIDELEKKLQDLNEQLSLKRQREAQVTQPNPDNFDSIAEMKEELNDALGLGHLVS